MLRKLPCGFFWLAVNQVEPLIKRFPHSQASISSLFALTERFTLPTTLPLCVLKHHTKSH